MVSAQNGSDLEFISMIFDALERVRDRTTDMMERMFSIQRHVSGAIGSTVRRRVK
jgi:hypothetical protein